METPAWHPKKGACVVREVLTPVGRVKVRLDFTTLELPNRECFLDELLDRQGGDELSLAALQFRTPAPSLAPSGPVPTWHEARQTIHALRLGQCTPLAVRKLSVGMETIDEACRWAWDRAGTGQLSFLLFVGPYGTGKSHALERMRVQALGAGMAVGGLVLDGMSSSLCLPMSLPSALAHSIEFRDGREPLPSRLANLVRTGGTSVLRTVNANFLHDSLSELSERHVDDPELWETVEDYLSLDVKAAPASRILGVHLPSMTAQRRDDRPTRCAMLLREWSLACTCRNVGGCHSLAVLLDEADVDFAVSGRTAAEREQRGQLLQAFRDMADGGNSGETYAKLVVTLVITPGGGADNPVAELEAALGVHLKVVKLPELSESDLRELGSRIARMYARAYELPETAATGHDALIAESLTSLSRRADSRHPRRFIRLLLEKLDAVHA